MSENWIFTNDKGSIFICGDLTEENGQIEPSAIFEVFDIQEMHRQEREALEDVIENMCVDYNRPLYHIEPIENFTIIEKEELE